MKRLMRVITSISLLLMSVTPAFASDQAKNVIVLISDGWGENQILATDYYQCGTSGTQSYESFPVNTVMSNFMVPGGYDPNAFWADFNYGKNGPTDSAAAATAMSTGEKSYSGAIGVDVNKNPLIHFMQYAEEAGKATGVVTSVEFSHATPAGYVAHNVSRNNYSDIAREMILDSTCEVIMGAGHPLYDHDGNPASSNSKYIGGIEILNGLMANASGFDLDGDGFADNMVEDVDGDGIADPWVFIEDQADFQTLMSGPTPKRVVGVPKIYQTLQYNRADNEYDDLPYSDPFVPGIPTLAEMTAAAINVLDNDIDGFVLMIEGGAVDWAGHGNALGRLIEEQMDFNDAVDVVVNWVNANSNWDETLVIVTGDHETGYLWGPDSGSTTFNMVTSNGKSNLPDYRFYSGSHSNQLIPFYAKGAGSSYFTGTGVFGTDSVRGDFTDNTKMFSGQMVATGLESAVAIVGVESFTAIEGGTVSVPVYVDMNIGDQLLGSYSLDISWDTDILQFAGVGSGDAGWDTPMVNTSGAASGTISISSLNPSGTSGKVTVTALQFSIAGEAGDVSNIDISVKSLGAAQTLINLTDDAYIWHNEFSIKPRPGIWGDADGNRMVDSFDGLIIASYVIGVDVGEHQARVMQYGDVTADGTIGLADAYACVLYDVDPSNPSLPNRIGMEFGTVPKAAIQPVAYNQSESTAIPHITSSMRTDDIYIVTPSISAETPLGAGSVKVSWNPSKYTFSGIDNASGLFVVNQDNTQSGELTLALISMNGTTELVFPDVLLESLSAEAGVVTVTGMEAIQSGSLVSLSIDQPAIVTAVKNDTPGSFALEQNVPNPFNPVTTISFTIPTRGHVSLDIYNIQGQKIRTLLDGVYAAGHQNVVWDATDDFGISVSSGVYIYRLTTQNTVTAKRMMLVR